MNGDQDEGDEYAVGVNPDSLVGEDWIWDDRYDAYVTAMGSETEVDFFYNFDDEGSRMFAITAYDGEGSFVQIGYAATSSVNTYTVVLTLTAGSTYEITFALAGGYVWKDDEGTVTTENYTYYITVESGFATPVTDPTTTSTAYEDANGDLYTDKTSLSGIFGSFGSATCGYTVIVDGVEYTYNTDDFYAEDGTALSGIELTAGTTYEITFALAGGYVWKDDEGTVTTEDCTYTITVYAAD